jgi:MoaA/NifB/PqqE/SkfB family radical SAM enzyme
VPSFSQGVQLLRGLIDGERAFGGPYYVGLGLTCRCNLSCLGCPYHSSRRRAGLLEVGPIENLPLPLAESIAEQLQKAGCHLVIITGAGEPLLHPRWFEILSLFKRAGLTVELTSNGTLIDEETAALLVESGLQSLSVSTWAVSEEVHAKLYPGTDLKYMYRRIEGLRRVSRAKAERRAALPRLVFKTTITRHNRSSIEDMVRIAHQTGCDAIALSPYRDWGGEFGEAALPPEGLDHLRQDLERAAVLAHSLGLKHSIGPLIERLDRGPLDAIRHPCYVGWFYTRIRFDGTVGTCGQCFCPVGDLKEESLQQIWNGEAYRSFRRTALRRGGVTSYGIDCDCSWCCSERDNRRVDRVYRWIAPLLGRQV